MKNRLVAYSIILAVAFNLLLGLQIFTVSAEDTVEDNGYKNIAIFTRALQLIRQDYVDSDKISYRDLTFSALKGMMAELDPHSAFLPPTDYKTMQDDTRGDFGGIGVVISIKEGVLTVVSPMEGTPGFKVGLKPGDQIIKIDGITTEKLEISDAVDRLRGEPGSKVTITVLRPSTQDINDYEITREVIPVESVVDEQLLDDELTGGFKIGYVRLTQFTQPTAEDLSIAIDELEEQGMEALVLDLRFNPGGLLGSARDVAAQFLDPNQMVVYTEGRRASQMQIYKTPPNYTPRRKFPMAILINSGSASASEIVAGALKDLDRAVLVGETTFGKGSVQSVVPLPDGSALRMTTAKYYTPSQQVIHEQGVSPHIRVTLTPREEGEVMMLRRKQYLSDDELERISDLRDEQLERAVDALKGQLIFAEGKESEADKTEEG